MPFKSYTSDTEGTQGCVGNCNCNCKYDKLYSTVGGKPLLGCFTRTFTVRAISNTRDHRSSTVSTVFESRKGVGFPNSCRKTVPGTWTSDLKGSIANFTLGSWFLCFRYTAMIPA